MKYFEGVRRRTVTAVDRVTPPLAAFRPKPDEWTCGEIVRHLTGAERFFVTKVMEDRFSTDLDLGPAEPWEITRARLDETHASEMARFLMAMVEHEVHHRSQLDAWLALAGTEPPQIYGYRMEDVVARLGARA